MIFYSEYLKCSLFCFKFYHHHLLQTWRPLSLIRSFWQLLTIFFRLVFQSPFPYLFAISFNFLIKWYSVLFNAFLLTHFLPVLHLCRKGSWFLLAKCLRNTLRKSDILTKDADQWPVNLYLKCHSSTRCFSNFLLVKTNYLVYPVSGTLVGNGLIITLQSDKIPETSWKHFHNGVIFRNI